MSDIENQWAWGQVEAAADGTLTSAERRRMRAAIDRDDRLREAVARATTLRRALQRLPSDPVPSSLRQRLLRIPRGARPAHAPRSRTVALVTGLGLAAAAAIAAIVLLLPAPTTRDTASAKQDQAVAEFGVAMTYLRHSVSVAGSESTEAVRGALADGGSARGPRPEPNNGD